MTFMDLEPCILSNCSQTQSSGALGPLSLTLSHQPHLIQIRYVNSVLHILSNTSTVPAVLKIFFAQSVNYSTSNIQL